MENSGRPAVFLRTYVFMPAQCTRETANASSVKNRPWSGTVHEEIEELVQDVAPHVLPGAGGGAGPPVDRGGRDAAAAGAELLLEVGELPLRHERQRVGEDLGEGLIRGVAVD